MNVLIRWGARIFTIQAIAGGLAYLVMKDFDVGIALTGAFVAATVVAAAHVLFAFVVHRTDGIVVGLASFSMMLVPVCIITGAYIPGGIFFLSSIATAGLSALTAKEKGFMDSSTFLFLGSLPVVSALLYLLYAVSRRPKEQLV